MENLYAHDEPSATLTHGIDLNDLRDPQNNGVEFEVKDESKEREDDTDIYQAFDTDDIFKNMYQDDYINEDNMLEAFDIERSRMQDISDDEGVMKTILKPGAGNVVPSQSLVRIHYNLYLEGSDEPFDSSRLRGEICKFRLGQGSVIIGLEIAVSSMKKGEKSRFLFTPEYAYGKMGCGERIPGSSTVLAEIELLSFIEQEGVDDFYNMTETERKAVKLDHIMKVCKAHKNDGKDLFQNKQYQKSFTRYKKAADLLEMYNLKNEDEEENQQKMLKKLYLNMSLCCLNLCHSGRAINYCKRVLEIEPNNCKALFRYGKCVQYLKDCKLDEAECPTVLKTDSYVNQVLDSGTIFNLIFTYEFSWKNKALRQVQEFERSRTYYKKAQKLEPHNKEISQALVELENIVKKTKIVEESFCRRMFNTTISENKDTRENKPKAKPELSGINDGFKTNVEKVLNDFKEDHSSMEMQFPPTQLTPPELACIFEVALDMGLDVRQFGSGQNLQLKVMKKSPDN